MTGIDLFENNHFYDDFDIEAIEVKYNYSIPPIFKSFIRSFKWKELDFKNLTFYFYPQLEFGDIYFPFQNVEDMILNALRTNDDDIISNQLITLATGFKGIYIGTLGDQKDKILLDDNGDFKEIAKDIFNFFQGVTDNLVKSARSEHEYIEFMRKLGYTGEELRQEGKEWIKYK